MKLLTKAHRERLLRNGRNRDRDHPPVVKFFNPCGAATWLFNELDEDGDTLFGLADLGFGTPELGYSSLSEIASIRVRFGLRHRARPALPGEVSDVGLRASRARRRAHRRVRPRARRRRRPSANAAAQAA